MKQYKPGKLFRDLERFTLYRFSNQKTSFFFFSGKIRKRRRLKTRFMHFSQTFFFWFSFFPSDELNFKLALYLFLICWKTKNKIFLKLRENSDKPVLGKDCFLFIFFFFSFYSPWQLYYNILTFIFFSARIMSIFPRLLNYYFLLN